MGVNLHGGLWYKANWKDREEAQTRAKTRWPFALFLLLKSGVSHFTLNMQICSALHSLSFATSQYTRSRPLHIMMGVLSLPLTPERALSPRNFILDILNPSVRAVWWNDPPPLWVVLPIPGPLNCIVLILASVTATLNCSSNLMSLWSPCQGMQNTVPAREKVLRFHPIDHLIRWRGGFFVFGCLFRCFAAC